MKFRVAVLHKERLRETKMKMRVHGRQILDGNCTRHRRRIDKSWTFGSRAYIIAIPGTAGMSLDGRLAAERRLWSRIN